MSPPSSSPSSQASSLQAPELQASSSPLLSSLFIYPLKAARGIALSSALALPPGLALDRRLMLVDPQGIFVSQRTLPKLTLLSVSFPSPPSWPSLPLAPQLDLEGSLLELSAPGLPSLLLDPSAPFVSLLNIQIFRSSFPAEVIQPDAAHVLSAWLQTPVHIVRLPADLPRQANPAYAPATPVSFADGYPLLLCNQASLDDLRARLASSQTPPHDGSSASSPPASASSASAASLSMARFRPNLVVSGLPPWDEDRWLGLSFNLGDAVFRVVKPCERCSVLLVDPDTASVSSEPLRTLATFRKVPSSGHVSFGQNLICTTPGLIRLGEPFELRSA